MDESPEGARWRASLALALAMAMGAGLVGGCAMVTTVHEGGRRTEWHWGALDGAARLAPDSPLVYTERSAWGLVLEGGMLAVGKVDHVQVATDDPRRCQAVIVVATQDQARQLLSALDRSPGLCIVKRREP